MIGIVNAAMVAAGEKNERFRLDSSAATVVVLIISPLFY